MEVEIFKRGVFTKYSKNIIATVLICAVVSTVAFAAAEAPLWTLNGKTVQTKADKNGTWVFVPKNFVYGTLVNESAPKQQTKKSKISYKSIFDEYSAKLKTATPKLIKELHEEAEINEIGIWGLSLILNQKTDSLSRIYFEGAAKLAKGLYEQGLGKENEYFDYSQKLEDIWYKEMQKIEDAIS